MPALFHNAYVWGNNNRGQLGLGQFSYSYVNNPTKLPLDNIKSIKYGCHFCCVLTNSGDVYRSGWYANFEHSELRLFHINIRKISIN